MKFTDKIKHLQSMFNKDECQEINGAFLYGIFKPAPPLAKHIVFEPMDRKVMRNLIENYKLSFPKELLELYQTMNGANLFWDRYLMDEKSNPIPINYLSIYGVPHDNSRIHIQPFNISIEDLKREDEIPDSWLKFGSYKKKTDLRKQFDLFVDTNGGKVFSVLRGDSQCFVQESWNSIDSCLCSVFDMLLTE